MRKNASSCRFKIVVPSFNSIHYLPKTLLSIEKQTQKPCQVCVIDDASSLPQQREIIQQFACRNEWKTIFHKTNQGALASIVEAIRGFNCEDDDILVMVDGDDWLYDEFVLERLHHIYTKEDVYLTWGQFETFPAHHPNVNYALPIPDFVIKEQLYREITDIFGHLKTYKYRLFKEIQDIDLRDPESGEYFRVSWDKALMYPMLEMAAEKVRFIPELMYVYNLTNPLSDFVINREEQIRATEIIRAKRRYSPLF